MEDKTRIEKDIVMFQENIKKIDNMKLNNKQDSIVQLARQYFEDSKYYGHERSRFDCRLADVPG